MNTQTKKVPKLRFKEFSGEWVEKNLEDISNISSSKRVYFSDYVDFGIPFYRGKEISELKRGIQPSDILYISEESYYNFKDKFGVPECGDILITAVGTLGNALRITNNEPFYFKDGNLIWLTSIVEESLFLEYLLDAKRKDIELSSIGSTQRALTIVGLKKLKFSFPRQQEQQKIADFLSSVDKKIQHLKQKKQLLEQYKKGMMQKLFSQQIRFKDENGMDYPEWKSFLLKDLSNKVISKNKDEKINAVLTNSAKQGIVNQTDYFTKDIANENNLGNYTIVNMNDFVYNPRISELAPYGPIKRNHIGVGVMSPLYTVFRFKDTSLLNYIEYFFETDKWHKYMWNISNFGARSDRMNISNNDFFHLSILVPCKKERIKIADFLTSIDKKIDLTNSQIAQTEQFKKGLLQQLFV